MRWNDLVSPCITSAEVKEGVRFGIELEYEGAKPRSKVWAEDIPGWTITKDNSLRNGGIEFVSHITLPDHLHTRLSNVEKVVHNYKLDPHKRCGVHTHINMTDCTYRDLWCVSVYYALLEPTIFQYFAPNRTDNHFCVPLYYCENMLGAFDEDTTAMRNAEAGLPTVKRRRNLKGIADMPDFIHMEVQGGKGTGPRPNIIGASAKYSALNYRTLERHGTLEFRHLPATTDFLLVESWCEFLAALREEALTYSDPNDIIDDYYERGLEGLAADVGIMPKNVNPEDQEDAEVLALTMGGAKPESKEELDWSIGG